MAGLSALCSHSAHLPPGCRERQPGGPAAIGAGQHLRVSFEADMWPDADFWQTFLSAGDAQRVLAAS